MNVYLLPGICGLLLGLLLQYTGFTGQRALQDTLAFRRSYALRSGLYAVGASMMLTALLCWLAVIDVDTIVVLPLSLGVLLGGVVFGIAAGVCGYTPLTAFVGLGGGTAAEALCCMAGCVLGAWLLPMTEAWVTPLRTASPYQAATLFQVTLDEPWLLGGGFLGQGCAGLLLMAIAVCIPSPRKESAEQPVGEELPAEEIPNPEDAPQETFVALLPGEEPLVVDTAMDGNPEEDKPQAEDAVSEEGASAVPEEKAEEPEDEAPAGETGVSPEQEASDDDREKQEYEEE